MPFKIDILQCQLGGAFLGAVVAFIVYYGTVIPVRECPHSMQMPSTNLTAARTKCTAPKRRHTSLHPSKWGMNELSLNHTFSGAAHLGWFNGLLDQVIATAMFCLLIAHITDKRNHYPTWVQPYLVGTAFVLVGTAFCYNAG